MKSGVERSVGYHTTKAIVDVFFVYCVIAIVIDNSQILDIRHGLAKKPKQRCKKVG